MKNAASDAKGLRDHLTHGDDEGFPIPSCIVGAPSYRRRSTTRPLVNLRSRLRRSIRRGESNA